MHFLVEKPGGLSPNEARSIHNAAVRSERSLRVGYNRRFLRSTGRLGELVARQESRSVSGSVRYEFEIPAASWDPVSDFRDEREGIVHDLLSHQIDLMTWILSRRISSVEASWENDEASGLRAELAFSGGLRAVCSARYGDRYVDRVELALNGLNAIGTNAGVVSSRYLSNSILVADLRGSRRIRSVIRRLAGRMDPLTLSYRRQLEGFLTEITEPPYESQEADLIENHLVLQAVMKSVQEGGTVEILR